MSATEGNGKKPHHKQQPQSPQQQHQPRYIGIDLGTTYSAMAWLDPHGTPVTLPNAEDEPTTPSVVLFEPSGEVVVGREAKRAAVIVPDLVADYVKRDMGLPQYHKRINFRFFSPASISALVLKKLKQDAERRIGPIAGAVITVPAYFDEKRRRATAAAGEMAGLKVIDILNEPTAAALAYAFRDFVNNGGKADDQIARAIATTAPHVAVVYDLGGGTFDVTVLRIAGDDLTVLATDGDAQLGGRDWDECIVNWACRNFKKVYRSDPRKDPNSLQQLVLAAEEAKKDLSRLPKTRLMVTHAGQTMPMELTREEFESMTAELLDRTRQRVSQVIADAGLTWGQVHEVLAVGGSARMPMVLRMLLEITGKQPNCSLPPGEAVAHGAAIHAAIKAVDLWNEQQKRARRQVNGNGKHAHTEAAPPPPAPAAPSDPFAGIEGPREPVESLPLGHDEDQEVENVSAAPIASPRASQDIPLTEEAAREALLQQVLSDETIDLELDGDPTAQFDPAVQDTLKRVKKTDVNAHSLGVVVTRTHGGRGKSVLIPRNTPLPASATKIYGTQKANQPEVIIRIIEGESFYVDECNQLGVCRITGLPPGLPKGSPVEVTFTLDGSGRLHVRAVETTSGQSVTTSIVCDAGITREKIDRARHALESISVL
jgi:molecular chaperone DnaK (HSP70)